MPSNSETSAPRGRGGSLLGVLRLVHPFPSFLVAGVTVALIPLADPDAPASLYLQLGLGMVLFQFAIGTANDLVDAETDATAKPWKPIVRGQVSQKTAVTLTAIFSGGGLVVTSGLPLDAWLIGVAGLLCGLSYDAYFKRSPLSFVPWMLAFPIVPAWVFVAADAWTPFLWWVFPLGGTLGLSLYLANQAPDVEQDSRAGVKGSAQRLGRRSTLRLAVALFGIAVSTMTIVLLVVSPPRAGAAAATGLVALLLLPRATAIFGRDGLFGVLAASSAALAVLFLSAA